MFINDFEEKALGELQKIPTKAFIKEAKLLASYDDSISTRQLSLAYSKFDF